jgi:uncharacterized protein YwgA
MKNLREGAAIVCFFVKKLEERDDSIPIGKARLQKLMYLLQKEIEEDFEYSFYYYGPFSIAVAQYIDYAELHSALDIQYNPDTGFSISTREEQSKFLALLSDIERKAIEKIVEKYHNFNAKELSIIATYLFLKEKFKIENEEKLLQAIKSLKPNYSEEEIKKVLSRASLLNEVSKTQLSGR